jgi:hypothetical protein
MSAASPAGMGMTEAELLANQQAQIAHDQQIADQINAQEEADEDLIEMQIQDGTQDAANAAVQNDPTMLSTSTVVPVQSPMSLASQVSSSAVNVKKVAGI